MSTTIHLEDYAAIVGKPAIRRIRTLAKRFATTRVLMVNSTAVGGGVAEILERLVPLIRDAGVPVRWKTIAGDETFFSVTKAFHNALQGEAYVAPPNAFEIFLETSEKNRRRIKLDDDMVVIHDPQPLALVSARDRHRNSWVWRCHIDLSRPNPQVWNFLRPFIERYDAAIFSSRAFMQKLRIPEYQSAPSIDPLADKNREIEPAFIAGVLERYRIDPSRPIVVQISRFDKFKDPVGVIQAYRIVKQRNDCQLVLAGGGASDDPESATVLQQAREAAGDDPDIRILNMAPDDALEINALQRAATIVVQKSLREGFGLTVSEALWKKRPVVASAVGGILLQVKHRRTGMLVHSVEGCARQIRYLLAHPDIARRLGENGYRHVKRNFLITHEVERFLGLLSKARRNH